MIKFFGRMVGNTVRTAARKMLLSPRLYRSYFGEVKVGQMWRFDRSGEYLEKSLWKIEIEVIGVESGWVTYNTILPPGGVLDTKKTRVDSFLYTYEPIIQDDQISTSPRGIDPLYCPDPQPGQIWEYDPSVGYHIGGLDETEIVIIEVTGGMVIYNVCYQSKYGFIGKVHSKIKESSFRYGFRPIVVDGKILTVEDRQKAQHEEG